MLLVAGRLNDTNAALLSALRRLGLGAEWVPPHALRTCVKPSDVVLGRLDILPSLDGVESGLAELRRARAKGVTVLNGADVLLTSHDKLATALACAAAGVPHPATANVDETSLAPPLPLPIVLKPRFGSWGADVYRCETVGEYAAGLSELSTRPWFVSHGVLVQELVEPRGYDLRVIVAGGRVIGAIERHAQRGEWRTNVALGAVRRKARLTDRALGLACEAAASVTGDLVGVDLLPVGGDDYVVLEINGAVDFTTHYSLDGRDVFEAAAAEIAATIGTMSVRAPTTEALPPAPALELA